MKNIVISADGDKMVYSVPDIVAENLDKYCTEFCTKWLLTSPHAEKYRIKRHDMVCLCYGAADFIEYLNKWVFPDEPAVFVENLGWLGFDELIPEKYKDCPRFNF